MRETSIRLCSAPDPSRELTAFPGYLVLISGDLLLREMGTEENGRGREERERERERKRMITDIREVRTRQPCISTFKIKKARIVWSKHCNLAEM